MTHIQQLFLTLAIITHIAPTFAMHAPEPPQEPPVIMVRVHEAIQRDADARVGNHRNNAHNRHNANNRNNQFCCQHRGIQVTLGQYKAVIATLLFATFFGSLKLGYEVGLLFPDSCHS